MQLLLRGRERIPIAKIEPLDGPLKYLIYIGSGREVPISRRETFATAVRACERALSREIPQIR